MPSALAGIGKLDPAERRIIEQSGLRDPSLLYPDDESLVPSWALFLVCFFGPGAVMILLRLLTPTLGWMEVHHVHRQNTIRNPLKRFIRFMIFFKTRVKPPIHTGCSAVCTRGPRRADLSLSRGHQLAW